MSDNQGQSEPSMEEILASIRRIISEEDGDEAKPAAEAPAAESPVAAAGAEEATGADEDDVLELTELDALPDEVPGEEPVEEPDEILELDEADALADAQDAPDAAAPRSAAAEAEIAAREVEADLPGAVEEPVDQDEGPGSEAAAGAVPDWGEADLGEADRGGADQGGAGERPMGDSGLRDGLVSASTAAATTAALSELTRRRRVPASVGTPSGGESVEAFVGRLLEPHLRDWLDANLEQLVERVVRDEVRRLARRAEDD